MTVTKEDILKLAGGNPGAIDVVVNLLRGEFVGTVERMIELKLLGQQVYLASHDYAEGDLKKMTIGVMQLDPVLLSIWDRNGDPYDPHAERKQKA